MGKKKDDAGGRDVSIGECVQVAVRSRKLMPFEAKKGYKPIVDADEEGGTIVINNPDKSGTRKAKKRRFTFDFVFDEHVQQIHVYDTCVRPIVEKVLQGYNGTIFAYGQTGSGKTFTMQGSMTGQEDLMGIIPNAYQHIFRAIHMNTDEKVKYLVSVSYIEIYMEEIVDLISKKGKLQVRQSKEKGVFVDGLKEVTVTNWDEFRKIMEDGQKSRHVAATAMNADSSRSHSIFTVRIDRSIEKEGQDRPSFTVGKLHLVDLAGSERIKRTETTGQRMTEGILINKSLSSLGAVIRQLVQGKDHVSYRDSVLTRLLSDSLGGNSVTLMIAAVSPSSSNFDETLGTLQYADQAKQIKNRAVINEDPKDAKLRQLGENVAKLRAELAAMTGAGGEEGDVGVEYEYEYETESDESESASDEIEEDLEAGGYSPEEIVRIRAERERKKEERREARAARRASMTGKKHKIRIRKADLEAKRAALESQREELDKISSKSKDAEKKAAKARRKLERMKEKDSHRNEKKEALRAQIAAAESQVVVGGKDMISVLEIQEEEKRRLAAEKAENKRRVARQRAAREEAERDRLERENQFKGVEEKKKAVVVQAEELHARYMRVKDMAESRRDELDEERGLRQALEDDLQREVDFMRTLVQSYIPHDMLLLIEANIESDEDDVRVNQTHITGNAVALASSTGQKAKRLP